MRRIDVLIIGGGQAGLAMSRCLSARRIDHVVLERGQVAARWRGERWDSLRLLTPNWMTRLPGYVYDGRDPDGYMQAPDVVSLLDRYALDSRAPVVTETRVVSLVRTSAGFLATTDFGSWSARQVVIATGHCDVPNVPGLSTQAPAWLQQLAPTGYRNPDQLPPGGVLIVGASATGLQLADELVRAGRRVTMAVGKHTRAPRLYRGRDLFEWLDRLGLLRETAAKVHDIEASRAQPSFQLVGRPTHDSLDLRGLAARGVVVTGRLAGLDGNRAWFDDDLVSTVAAADVKLAALLQRIDAAAGGQHPEPPPFVPLWPAFVDASPRRLDLRRAGVSTVIWATGYRRRYDWLHGLACDDRGEIVHTGGQTPVPGLFVLGLQFLRHRSSSFIDGVGVDAVHLADLVARNLGHAGVAA